MIDCCSRGKKTDKDSQPTVGRHQAENIPQSKKSVEEEKIISEKKVTSHTGRSEKTQETGLIEPGTHVSLTSKSQAVLSKSKGNTASSNVFEAISRMMSSDSASSGTESDESDQVFVSFRMKGKSRGDGGNVTTSSKTQGSSSEVSGIVRPKTGKTATAGKSTTSKGRTNKRMSRKVTSSDTESTDSATRNQTENRHTLESDDLIRPPQTRKQKGRKVDTSSSGNSVVSRMPKGETSTKRTGRKKGTIKTKQSSERNLVTVDIDNRDETEEFDLDYNEPQLEKTKPKTRKQATTARTEVSSGEESEPYQVDEKMPKPSTAKRGVKGTPSLVQKQTRKRGRKPRKQVDADVEYESEEFDVEEETRSMAVSRKTDKKLVASKAQNPRRKTEKAQRQKRPNEATVVSPAKKVASSQSEDSAAGSGGGDVDQLYDFQVNDRQETPTQSGRKTNARKRIVMSETPETDESPDKEEEADDRVYEKQTRKRKAGVRGKQVSVRSKQLPNRKNFKDSDFTRTEKGLSLAASGEFW